MPEVEPERLGDYRLLEKLGQGGMAVVYRGERVGEAGFKKQVALKRMLPQYRRVPALLERFAAEARTNARLDHPNLVHVGDFGIEPEPFLVMEFVEGVTLAELLTRLAQRGQRLEIAAACFIGAQAAEGLDYAHRKRDEQGLPLGIVHRDVSPQNVLLSSDGAVKVSDFGLVKAADNVVQTATGVSIGKICYMAPEQAGHLEVDARADVFSLGVVVWEMLAMRPMLSTDPAEAAQMLARAEFEAPSKYNPEISPELDEMVLSCLKRDPNERTPSAQAVAMSLRETLHELAPGYGREQLSRLLSWALPERGWLVDEPHETAAQPSAEDRLSLPQVAVAPGLKDLPAKTQRISRAPQAPSEKAGGHSPRFWLWVALGAGGLLLATVLVIVLLFVAFQAGRATEEAAASDSSPPPVTAAQPAVFEGVTVETNIPAANVYLGARLLGVAPVLISPNEPLTGPLVIIAFDHQPSLIAAEQLGRDFTNEVARIRVELTPSRRPDQMIYVNSDQPGTVVLPFHRQRIGQSPGVVRVSPRRRVYPPQILVITADGETTEVDIRRCSIDTLCIVRP